MSKWNPNFSDKLKSALDSAPSDFPFHFEAERRRLGIHQHKSTTASRYRKRLDKRIALNLYNCEVEFEEKKLIEKTKKMLQLEDNEKLMIYKSKVIKNPIDYNSNGVWKSRLEEFDRIEKETGITKEQAFANKTTIPEAITSQFKIEYVDDNGNYWNSMSQ
jgi:hypothetical protein